MHISGQVLTDVLSTWGYVAVFVFVAIESSGIPFPGETMLITAAAYAGAGHLTIGFVIGAAACGAIIVDNLGYVAGKTGGRGIVLKYGKYIRLDESKLKVAELFFQKHGDKTVFLGRFVAVLRAWAAFLAGLNRMPWPTFLFYNGAGGIAWALLYGVLAFYLGRNLPLLHRVVQGIGVVGVVLAILFAIFIYVMYRQGRLFSRHERQLVSEAKDANGE
ncbi:MAG: hypothetical protein NVSMB52_17280 [Chloroflexota bacterium]